MGETVEMFVAPVQGAKFTQSYEFAEELSTPGGGKWVLLPTSIRQAGVTLSFESGGSGYIEATTEPIDVLRTGSPIAEAWPAGTVNATTQHILICASAVRQVNVGGKSRMSIRTQM